MMLTGNDDILHPGILGDSHKLISVELDRIKLFCKRFIFRDGYICSFHNPLTDTVNSLTFPLTGQFDWIPDFTQTGTYDVTFSASDGTLQADEIHDFANVWLQDLYTGDIIDLYTNSYTFEFNTYDEAGRFIIHFTPIGNIDPPWVLKVYAYGDKIYINTPDDNNNYFASARDVFGKEILAQMELAPGLTAIRAEPDKCYFVKILINKDEERTYTVFTFNYYPMKNGNTFLLFPNPFHDKLNILQTWSQKNNFIVTILNNLGHEIKRIPSDKYDNQIELGFLKPGVYYFIIEEGNTTNIEIKKMVKR